MDPINKAIRNAGILKWYASLPLIAGKGVLTRSSLVVDYANHLQCPVCEVVPTMTGEDDLDYLWSKHRKLIEDFLL